MDELKQLADFIFPDITMTPTDLEKRYPPRDLKEHAYVTRFAPSPTGFLHTGSLFTAMIAYRLAQSTNGIFYIRLEDTDTKREIEGSGISLIEQLTQFGIVPDEGYLGNKEVGIYGPYKQSERAEIYKVMIKYLLTIGRAYPCFCTPSDLDNLRKMQEEKKIIPGYYGEFAKCRTLNSIDALKRIQAGEPYVIRFKSLGNHENKIAVHDEIRGDLELTENDQDIVILKSDGLPTYHFAHAVDDHFMHTNCVTRGEEWLSSLPIHLELFAALAFETPKYAHLPVIMKLDNGNRRKLSKRKDDEAAVSYFIADGYPEEALIQYLMTIANSDYEEWQLANAQLTYQDFALTFDKMSNDGALFDIMKLKFIAKELLSKMDKREITARVKKYANVYDQNLFDLINRDESYFESIMNIERNKENPRKDYEKYSDIFNAVKFFYDDYFLTMVKSELPFNVNIDKQIIIDVLDDFKKSLDLSLDEQVWFASLKEVAVRHNFAENNKIFKANKDLYLGHIGDVAEIIRIALTTSKQSPNIYYVLQILGIERIQQRIDKVIAILAQ